MIVRVRSICSWLALLVAITASAQGTVQARNEDEASAFRAVEKAWSLPAEGADGAPYWPDARPEDLAAAAFLWKSGGPVPAEGWRLRLSEKSWEGAARRAGVPVDALLKEYRSLLNDQTRDALARSGEEWVVLAEFRTLERLTGRGAKAVASQLASGDFQALLLAALPKAGSSVSPPRPSDSPDQAPPNQWQASDPMGPIPTESTPKNTGLIGTGGPPRSR